MGELIKKYLQPVKCFIHHIIYIKRHFYEYACPLLQKLRWPMPGQTAEDRAHQRPLLFLTC
jgi:hypothetical protein